MTDSQVDLAVGSIVFAPSSPSIVYAGMGDTKLGYLGSGVLKSTNGGRTWAKVSNNTLPSPGAVARIEVDPENADRVYVAQYLRVSEEKVLSSGFYLSTDGGVSWTRTLTGAARDIAISPANRQTLFVGTIPRNEQTENMATPGLHRSTDGGNTWTNVLPVLYDTGFRRDVKVAVTPARPQAIYVFTGGIRPITIRSASQSALITERHGRTAARRLTLRRSDTTRISMPTRATVTRFTSARATFTGAPTAAKVGLT